MSTTVSSVTPDLTAAEQDRVNQAYYRAQDGEGVGAVLGLAREWKTQFAAAVQQREELAREFDASRAAHTEAITNLREVLAKERAAAVRFREQVRDVAIRVADEQDWCKEGLNEVLEELGLPLAVQTWSVEVEVTARQVVTVEVEAVDEDDAKERVRDGEVDLSPEAFGWEWQTADDLEFMDVSPA